MTGYAERRPEQGAASTDTITAPQPTQALRPILDTTDRQEAIRLRAVQQAVAEALAHTWRRRARMFEWAAPCPTDFTGNASAEQLAAARVRCADTAVACHRFADALEAGVVEPDLAYDLDDVIGGSTA